VISITLEKQESARSARLHFWPSAIRGHAEIDTRALPAEDGGQQAVLGALGLLSQSSGGGGGGGQVQQGAFGRAGVRYSGLLGLR
jgi:hypothetical protein